MGGWGGGWGLLCARFTFGQTNGGGDTQGAGPDMAGLAPFSISNLVKKNPPVSLVFSFVSLVGFPEKASFPCQMLKVAG